MRETCNKRTKVLQAVEISSAVSTSRIARGLPKFRASVRQVKVTAAPKGQFQIPTSLLPSLDCRERAGQGSK